MCDDLADKMHCLDVDQACHGLTNQSANIGFHKNATRIKEGIVMPDAWDNHSNYNTQRAMSEMKASTALREAINNMIEQTSNDLEAQRLRTEYAFRKRIHEVWCETYIPMCDLHQLITAISVQLLFWSTSRYFPRFLNIYITELPSTFLRVHYLMIISLHNLIR